MVRLDRLGALGLLGQYVIARTGERTVSGLVTKIELGRTTTMISIGNDPHYGFCLETVDLLTVKEDK